MKCPRLLIDVCCAPRENHLCPSVVAQGISACASLLHANWASLTPEVQGRLIKAENHFNLCDNFAAIGSNGAEGAECKTVRLQAEAVRLKAAAEVLDLAPQASLAACLGVSVSTWPGRHRMGIWTIPSAFVRYRCWKQTRLRTVGDVPAEIGICFEDGEDAAAVLREPPPAFTEPVTSDYQLDNLGAPG